MHCPFLESVVDLQKRYAAAQNPDLLVFQASLVTPDSMQNLRLDIEYLKLLLSGWVLPLEDHAIHQWQYLHSS